MWVWWSRTKIDENSREKKVLSNIRDKSRFRLVWNKFCRSYVESFPICVAETKKNIRKWLISSHSYVHRQRSSIFYCLLHFIPFILFLSLPIFIHIKYYTRSTKNESRREIQKQISNQIFRSRINYNNNKKATPTQGSNVWFHINM